MTTIPLANPSALLSVTRDIVERARQQAAIAETVEKCSRELADAIIAHMMTLPLPVRDRTLRLITAELPLTDPLVTDAA